MAVVLNTWPATSLQSVRLPSPRLPPHDLWALIPCGSILWAFSGLNRSAPVIDASPVGLVASSASTFFLGPPAVDAIGQEAGSGFGGGFWSGLECRMLRRAPRGGRWNWADDFAPESK